MQKQFLILCYVALKYFQTKKQKTPSKIHYQTYLLDENIFRQIDSILHQNKKQP